MGDTGRCDKCEKEFNYKLIHNGFNDSAYAYCGACGTTALLGGWFADIPKDAPLKLHGKISEELEHFIMPCDCGGHFTSSASPRCPHCRNELSAIDATGYLEKNATGTKQGWRWQQSWDGIYCIVIEDKIVNDNWKQRK